MKYLEHWFNNLERPFNNSVKKDDTGRTVYFPWSYLGKGRIIESAATEVRMRKAVKIYNFLWMVLALAFGVFFQDKSRLLILAMPAMWLLFHFVSRSILTGCPVSAEKLTLREHNTAVAKNFNEVALFLFLLVALVFTGVCIWALSASISTQTARLDKAIVFFGIFFFGLVSANLAYILSLKE